MLTNVTPELVRTLSQPETTSPGLLVLKPSSKSGLPIAWITGHNMIPQPRREVIYMISLPQNSVFPSCSILLWILQKGFHDARAGGQPETTSPQLLVLKKSSKIGLPIAWITMHDMIPLPKKVQWVIFLIFFFPLFDKLLYFHCHS